MLSRLPARLPGRPGLIAISSLVLCVGVLAPARSTENRLWLASQHDWGAKRGFYLDFENSAPGDEACGLRTLRLILGVADGKAWRFIDTTPAWQLGRGYTVRATIGPGRSELWLDGDLVGSADAVFLPAEGSLSANTVPGWASGRTDYLIRQSSLRLAITGGQAVERQFAAGATQPPLALFAAQPGVSVPWTAAPGRALTIEATFRLVPYPSLRELAPFIDRYGQSRHAEWLGKVHADADLKRATADEARRLRAMPVSSDYDRYGGYRLAPWREKAAGFYRTVRRAGVWWLVTPAGNPCFYAGACSAPALTWEQTPVTGRQFLYEWLPPKDPPYRAAWAANSWGIQDGTEYVTFHTANLIRKYGADWEQKAGQTSARRLRAWGFSGGGKWGAPEGLPCTPVLGRWDVPNLARHPDVFDPAVRATFRASLRRQIEPRRSDPLVLGWSLGNEYDEIVTRAEVEDVLRRVAAVPGKRALIDYARQELYGGDAAKLAQAWRVPGDADLYAAQLHPPAEDLERLRLYYARRYYEFVYRTVKELDPNHLYLGFWIVPGWWENEADWAVSAPYCDVIGYDRYADRFADDMLLRLARASDKPILCGEFSFPAWYGGTRGFGVYGTYAADDAQSGERYARWMADAAANPYCVGVMWFQYRDQPLTGRGPGHGGELVYGEHYAFGLVDVADNPKWDLVSRMRAANLGAVKARLGQKRE